MIKAAILVDGGYFLKRLPAVRPDVEGNDPEVLKIKMDIFLGIVGR